ncbi:RKD2 [Acrasis kona]|uniref:RKD2 n=1 Tax=Acrasis kona TaxID=1008807 RepID=A0AAW2ZMH6_9EUKA
MVKVNNLTEVTLEHTPSRKKVYTVTNPHNYTFEYISSYFYLTMKEAASSLNVSQTYLKRLCRHLNIPRWPHRRLSGILRKIEMKEANNGRSSTKAKDISKLKKELAGIMSGGALLKKSSTCDIDDPEVKSEEEYVHECKEEYLQEHKVELSDIERHEDMETCKVEETECSHPMEVCTPLGLNLDVEWISFFLHQLAANPQ